MARGSRSLYSTVVVVAVHVRCSWMVHRLRTYLWLMQGSTSTNLRTDYS